MAELTRWQTLMCPCGSTRFYIIYELRRHASGGLSQDPMGQRCAGCHKDADTAAMMRELQLARRRQELEAMEEEIASLTPQTPPPVPSS